MINQSTPPRLIVFSGAGLSADSGIPTFRDENGLWHNHNVDQVANGLTWKANWNLVRQFYNDRRTSLDTVEPNAMHYTIAAWEKKYHTQILTQNIDDLLERAGCEHVVHLHGKLTEMRCEACGHKWDIGHTSIGETDRCINVPKCQSLKGVRPNIVFFNEHAPNYRIMYESLRHLNKTDCVVVIGTSGIVINLDSLLFDSPCLKILNNLESGPGIDETIYDHVIFDRASKSADQLNDLVNNHMSRYM